MSDTWVMSAKQGAEPQPFVLTPATEWGPTFSPDGRWIAYTSDESGQYQVYVKRYPSTEDRWQMSTGYGEEPLWSAAGDAIFFRQGRDWMSVSVRTEPEFEHRPPRPLFRGPYLNVAGLSYDVTPDGRRFFLLKQREQPPPTQIHIVANWFEELKRLAPAN